MLLGDFLNLGPQQCLYLQPNTHFICAYTNTKKNRKELLHDSNYYNCSKERMAKISSALYYNNNNYYKNQLYCLLTWIKHSINNHMKELFLKTSHVKALFPSTDILDLQRFLQVYRLKAKETLRNPFNSYHST